MRTLVVVICWCAALCGAAANPPMTFSNFVAQIGIDQNIGAQLPLDAEFTDSDGRIVKLGELLRDKPALLAFVYYGCPQLCTEVMNGLDRSLRMVPQNAGSDFNVITISIDPRETPQLAAAKKANYIRQYARPNAAGGWHCLTGSQNSIESATRVAGFNYRYDEKTRQFAHAAGILVVTPQGRVSRYFLGLDYSPKDLRRALVEAGEGRTGSRVEQLLLLCYHYDPTTGKYGMAITRIIRAAGAVTALCLFGFITVSLWRERRRKSGAGGDESSTVASRISRTARLLLFSIVFASVPAHAVPLFPSAASTTARDVDALYFALLGVSAFFILLIFALITFFGIRYRHTANRNRFISQRGQTALEWTWIVIPLVIALGLFTWGAKAYVKMTSVPRDALEIYVVAKQWMWKAQHASGAREINELHVPAGRPVKLIMISQDVIHSFFVPAFRTKRDVLPGRYEAMWFNPTTPGEFHLFCAEYCGDQHSRMKGRIVVMPPAEFAAWEKNQSRTNESLAATGERLFRSTGCTSCHDNRSQERGPRLDHVFLRKVHLQNGASLLADEDYLRESLLRPGARLVAGYANLMPSYAGQLNDDQIIALVAYLKSPPLPSTHYETAAR